MGWRLGAVIRTDDAGIAQALPRSHGKLSQDAVAEDRRIVFATPRKGDIDCSSNTARTSPLTRLRSNSKLKPQLPIPAPAEFAGKLAPKGLLPRCIGGGGIFLNNERPECVPRP